MTFSTSRGRGLLLQRFAEIVGALAQLVEQPRVLDGDDGLGGEVLHQLDLLVGERPDLLAIDDDSADQLVVLEHRHAQERARAAELGRCAPGSRSAPRSLGVMSTTWTVCRGSISGRARVSELGANGPRGRQYSARPAATPCIAAVWIDALPSQQEQIAEVGFADAGRVRQHGVEHRLQLARRTGDDLQHLLVAVCCSSDSLRSSVRWRSSLSSRVFSIAMTACAAKFCTSSICLSVNGRTSWR